MGRPKIKVIDDSQPVEEPKKEASKRKAKKDDLVAKINAELGIKEEEKLDVGSEKLEKEVGDSKLEKTQKDQTSNIQPQKPTSNIKHPTSKSKPRSKKYQETAKDLDKSKFYPLEEAIDLVKKVSYSKFNGTLEAHLNTVTTGIRGLVSLPFASGKKLRILAFGKGASESGADKVGDEATIEEINKGKIDFDLLITTPDWMTKLAKVAKNLGPKGLMPNPKNGTITEDLKKQLRVSRQVKQRTRQTKISVNQPRFNRGQRTSKKELPLLPNKPITPIVQTSRLINPPKQ